MRKRLTGQTALAEARGASGGDASWDLDRLARVEVTSEEARYPIEAALLADAARPERDAGWRAATTGPQSIRLIFDEPQHLRLVELVFVEPEVPRTQEFVLRWSPDEGRSFREIVRQQWNFSPPGTVREAEEYRVDVLNLTVLELTIIPDTSGGAARASLARLRLA